MGEQISVPFAVQGQGGDGGSEGKEGLKVSDLLLELDFQEAYYKLELYALPVSL